MKKTIFALAFVVLGVINGWAQKAVVWDEPTTEYGTSYGDGFFNLALDVTCVELKDDETVVHIHAMQRCDFPEMWFQFAGDTYLKVGDKRYTITSADGIELNKHTQTVGGHLDMAFHFPPLPKGTLSFDFIEGDGDGAFQIKGIKPVEERWKQMLPSYWRDDATGEWKIALLKECAIYDCKFWEYSKCEVNEKTGESDIVMRNGDEELQVKVGKNKKGKRTIQVGKQKAVYSMITSRFMPEYPTKDVRTDFADSGYKVDTVTVVGWMKDMPEHYKGEKMFDIDYEDLFAEEQMSVHAEMDELGRFTAKIPVLNSTEVFCDWRRAFVRTMLETGKTYFMLYDFKEGRRYFMGDDARLQNELLKYPLGWETVSMDQGGDFDKYMVKVDSLLSKQYADIDRLSEEHPTLSARFNRYWKGNAMIQQARYFGQARFNAEGYKLPENARKYAYDNFWTKLDEPFTLHRDINTFLNDYIDDIASNVPIIYDHADHISDIASNAEEEAMMRSYWAIGEDFRKQIESENIPAEKAQKMAEELDAKHKIMIERVDSILHSARVRKIVGGDMLLQGINARQHVLDSLGAAPIIKDVLLGRYAYNDIAWSRRSLNPDIIDSLKAKIHNAIPIEMIEKRNDHYIAIENRDFDRLILKSSDNLKDLTEGEALLKKMLEPYKGKIVLLDVWGTWCGPCKEALSHSTEEYTRLADYDVEFMYLANSSPMDSWENVIKEYNVSGDNVAHYNLPDIQQAAIERHLDVHAYPSFFIFDRNGNRLDIKVDARDLDALEGLLRNLSNQ